MRRANRANARAARRRPNMRPRWRPSGMRCSSGSVPPAPCSGWASCWHWCMRWCSGPSTPRRRLHRAGGAPEHRRRADSPFCRQRDVLAMGDYQGVDCIREQDGFVYAAAYNGATLKKRKSDLVRTDGGSFSAILSVDGELTGFAFDADGDLWLTVLTPGGGACAVQDTTAGARPWNRWSPRSTGPAGAVSAVEAGPDGKVYFAVAGAEAVDNGLEAACAPSCWPTPAPAGCMCMTRRTGRCSGWSAAWPGHPAWPEPGRQDPVCFGSGQSLCMEHGR